MSRARSSENLDYANVPIRKDYEYGVTIHGKTQAEGHSHQSSSSSVSSTYAYSKEHRKERDKWKFENNERSKFYYLNGLSMLFILLHR